MEQIDVCIWALHWVFPFSSMSINQVDFVQNKINNRGPNVFRPLCDLDEEELINVADNSIKISVSYYISWQKCPCRNFISILQVDQGREVR